LSTKIPLKSNRHGNSALNSGPGGGKRQLRRTVIRSSGGIAGLQRLGILERKSERMTEEGDQNVAKKFCICTR